MLIRYMLNNRQQSVQALLGLGGKKDDRRISHEQEMISDFLFKLMHCLIVLLDDVPFIHDKYRSLARFKSITGNMFVLLDNAFLPVD
ncbi:hypothetical protein D3C77_641230 [compost metagenome]